MRLSARGALVAQGADQLRLAHPRTPGNLPRAGQAHQLGFAQVLQLILRPRNGAFIRDIAFVRRMAMLGRDRTPGRVLARRLFRRGAFGRARAALLAAAGLLVDGGPGPRLGLLLRHAALLVAFFDMLGLALLLGAVAALVSAGHDALLFCCACPLGHGTSDARLANWFGGKPGPAASRQPPEPRTRALLSASTVSIFTISPLDFLSAAQALVLAPVVIRTVMGEPKMKPRLLLSLALSVFAAHALALPGDDSQPLLGEARDSQQEFRPLASDLAEDGAERLLERRHGA